MLITSASNPKIKAIRKLRERKERQQSGLFYIEGLRIVAEAVDEKAAFDTILAAPELLTSEFGQQLLAEQKKLGAPVMEVSADVFKSLALKDGPQGLAAVVQQTWHPLEQITLRSGHTWVVLDEVADPGNLGTIMRAHDATGGDGIILLDHSTDPYDPGCIRGSMGAVFTQKLVKASFAEFAAWKKRSDGFLVGTSDKAKQNYHTTHYPEKVLLLMGSERHGLQEHHIQLCDQLVSIPMVGKSDSLNLAVATAVVLYEVFNQRQEGNHDSHNSG
jgi:TrmH family RNA methyltransferase